MPVKKCKKSMPNIIKTHQCITVQTHILVLWTVVLDDRSVLGFCLFMSSFHASCCCGLYLLSMKHQNHRVHC